ncbi:MAG: XRE family transcriptional regulator [Bacteroidales bacterium]|jgi:plasmid maintenance system antidote protein VapI|nr:XRE family transcriptional regulator [Bacteroidales bacterium]
MVHIGKIIEEKLVKESRTPAWLARQMGHHRSYVHRLLKKPTVDTGDLEIISNILKFNFFTCYNSSIEEYL